MGKHHHHQPQEKAEALNVIRKDLCRACYNDRKPHFTKEQALQTAESLGINFETVGYDLEQFRAGMDVELEHGLVNPLTNVTNDDPILTGKIALAHLNEFPDYYKRLAVMEEEARRYWFRVRKGRKGLF